jgi:hypothetical protein
MLIGYVGKGHAMTFAIDGSSTGASFLTDSQAMCDGRDGLLCSMRWIDGGQTTSSYVKITVTIASTLDATAAIGVVGVSNVQGLPEGTILEVNGVEQGLTYNEKGELGAWWIAHTTGNTQDIYVKNTDNSSSGTVIAAGGTFGIGEVFIGRLTYLPTLLTKNPSADLTDNTAAKTLNGGSDWPTFRKSKPHVSGTVGLFKTIDVSGRDRSTIADGGNPAGTIDLRTFRRIIAEAAVCAVCDLPSAGQGDGSVSNGIRFDQQFMQANWLLARPSPIGTISMSEPPRWTWPVSFVHTG